MVNIQSLSLLALATVIMLAGNSCESCTIVKRDCWVNGCSIDVKAQFVEGQQVTIKPKNGARVVEIWNADKVPGCSNSLCTVTIKYDTDNFGFNLQGNTNGRPELEVSCNSGGSGNDAILKPTQPFKASYDRMEEFVRQFTSVIEGTKRVVHSSGGVAGGVISEGQGYGLLIAGAVAASLPRGPKQDKAIGYAVQFYNGWKVMCQKSRGSKSCQSNYYCSGSPCLPHWKFDDKLEAVVGTGAAPDGDEDAILGMILLLKTTEGRNFSWWNEMSDWAYASCKAFIIYNTEEKSGKRILKLGTCWGGWDCINPSYFSPAHWRVFRNFMIQRNPTEGNHYRSKWNNLIRTTYDVLEANQCGSTGLVTNWWKPSLSNPAGGGTTGCNGSGTPAAEYGAEAARTMFRIALDYVWFTDEATEGVGAKTFCNRVSLASAAKVLSNSNLDTGCHVKSILPNWLDNAFMWAPTATCFVVPNENPQHMTALNRFAGKLDGARIESYFGGSWLVLSSIAIHGDFEKAKSILP